MKKKIFLLLGIAVLAKPIFSNENKIEIRAGFSPSPKFEVEPFKKAKSSYELGAEYRYLITNNVEIGAGIAYQKHGKLKKFTDIDSDTLRVDVLDVKLYDSVPVYATVKYNFNNESNVTPYIKANLGLSINTNNESKINYETYSKISGELLDSGKLKDIKIKNGVYYSIGAGISFKNFTTDLSFQVNTAKARGKRYDGVIDSGNADNKRITLSFGYQIGF